MIRVARSGRIATVTLDRPERMNALSPEMFRDLARFWRKFAADDALSVAIVTGTGRAFCAGRDIVNSPFSADERPSAGVDEDGNPLEQIPPASR